MWKWIEKAQQRLRSVNEIAADLTALGFTVEPLSGKPSRCGRCQKMHSVSMVMVPDYSEYASDLSFVIAQVRSWNGHSTGWCVRCAGSLLSLGDVQAEIQARAARIAKSRVERLAHSGDRAAEHPSKTPCGECDGTAGYTGGMSWGAYEYAEVLCPRCGWHGWEKTGGKGLTVTFS